MLGKGEEVPHKAHDHEPILIEFVHVLSSRHGFGEKGEHKMSAQGGGRQSEE